MSKNWNPNQGFPSPEQVERMVAAEVKHLAETEYARNRGIEEKRQSRRDRLRTAYRLQYQHVGHIAEAGARVNFVTMPDFLNGVGEALKVIIEVGNKMQGICRRAKKDIKRHGVRFWSKLDEWNAMRSAV